MIPSGRCQRCQCPFIWVTTHWAKGMPRLFKACWTPGGLECHLHVLPSLLTLKSRPYKEICFICLWGGPVARQPLHGHVFGPKCITGCWSNILFSSSACGVEATTVRKPRGKILTLPHPLGHQRIKTTLHCRDQHLYESPEGYRVVVPSTCLVPADGRVLCAQSSRIPGLEV